MDGNGRWAKKRGLPRLAGHRSGVKAIKKIVPVCDRLGIKYLTLYAFSKENWTRPEDEINGLMRLLVEFIDAELRDMIKNRICLKVIGNIEELPKLVRQKLHKAIEDTKNNEGVQLNLALNYGGRQEILKAVNEILIDYKNGQVKKEDVTSELLSQHLYTKDMPDPDLLIRTSGENRISNFLLWQLSYSEIYGTETLWPDFGEIEFQKAIDNYLLRERRYGNVGTSA